jgi:hypothetical protein
MNVKIRNFEARPNWNLTPTPLLEKRRGGSACRIEKAAVLLVVFFIGYLCLAYHFYFPKKGIGSLQWLICQFLHVHFLLAFVLKPDGLLLFVGFF